VFEPLHLSQFRRAFPAFSVPAPNFASGKHALVCPLSSIAEAWTSSHHRAEPISINQKSKLLDNEIAPLLGSWRVAGVALRSSGAGLKEEQ
jgi:hypothetical protein